MAARPVQAAFTSAAMLAAGAALPFARRRARVRRNADRCRCDYCALLPCRPGCGRSEGRQHTIGGCGRPRDLLGCPGDGRHRIDRYSVRRSGLTGTGTRRSEGRNAKRHSALDSVSPPAAGWSCDEPLRRNHRMSGVIRRRWATWLLLRGRDRCNRFHRWLAHGTGTVVLGTDRRRSGGPRWP